MKEMIYFVYNYIQQKEKIDKAEPGAAPESRSPRLWLSQRCILLKRTGLA